MNRTSLVHAEEERKKKTLFIQVLIDLASKKLIGDSFSAKEVTIVIKV